MLLIRGFIPWRKYLFNVNKNDTKVYLEWLPDIYDKVFFAKIENDYFCKNLYHRRLGQMFETFILCGTLFLKKKKKGLTQVKIHIKVC